MREGSDAAILAFGDRVAPACEAAEQLSSEGIEARVVDMRWVKPLDEDAITSAAETGRIVVVENGIIAGGAGSGVLEVLSRRGLQVPTKLLGIDDRNVPHGKPAVLLAKFSLDAAGIAAAVRDQLN
jgi:1-deoxy-D-xylulose-5-phosphate synthase